jgi:hypothetical protein
MLINIDSEEGVYYARELLHDMHHGAGWCNAEIELYIGGEMCVHCCSFSSQYARVPWISRITLGLNVVLLSLKRAHSSANDKAKHRIYLTIAVLV